MLNYFINYKLRHIFIFRTKRSMNWDPNEYRYKWLVCKWHCNKRCSVLKKIVNYGKYWRVVNADMVKLINIYMIKSIQFNLKIMVGIWKNSSYIVEYCRMNFRESWYVISYTIENVWHCSLNYLIETPASILYTFECTENNNCYNPPLFDALLQTFLMFDIKA